MLDIAKHPDELESIKSQFPKGDLEYVQGDIRDPAALKRAIRTGVRGTVHLAGYSRVLYCEENPEDCEDVNVRGTKALLHALPGGWVVLASSSQVSMSPRLLN